jgi:protease I
MARELDGRTIAMLIANEGVEQVELTEPRKALEEAGATVHLIAPEAGEAQAFDHLDKADRFPVDRAVDDVGADDYDGLVLPGGVANPDNLRMHPEAVAFVAAFVNAGKPIAAICHAPWTLIQAGAVRGRTLTSWPSLQTDLRNAGATWVDERCVVDSTAPTLVTSRGPDDLPAFNAKMVEQMAEGAREAHVRAEPARFEKSAILSQ